jgi:uncharacterized protein YjbI with pentapeptide repeats
MGKVVFPNDTLTIIVKGTFRLQPGGKAEPVDPDQQIPPTGDLHYGGDPHASCRYETDFVHFKPRADLLLAGHCHAPGGEPAPAGTVRFHVGDMQRALMVFGDRHWRRTRIGTRAMSDPEPFIRMELRYENSFGGPDYGNNPVGKGICAKTDGNGRSHHKLANLKVLEGEKLKTMIQGTPAGFGPLGKTWAHRRSLAGSYGDQWKKGRWPWLPEDFDWRYCNAAPPDQQVEGYLKGDEPVYFENLHPEHAAYHSALPGVRVRCFLSEYLEGQRRFREINTRLDTLWADMDDETLVLVWRGLATVGTPDCNEAEALLVVQEPVSKTPSSLEHYEKLLRRRKAEADAVEEETEPEAYDAQDEQALDNSGTDAGDADMDATLGKTMAQAHDTLDQSGLDAGHIGDLKMEKDPEVFARNILKALNLDPLAAEKLKAHVRKEHAASLDRYRPGIEKILEENGHDPALLNEPDAFSIEDQEEASDASGPEGTAGASSGKNMDDGGDISGADFSGQFLEGADFRESQLDGADFSDARLSGADFSDASLVNAVFSGADLTGANFTNADMSHARLDHARLQDADLSGAVLAEAMLKKADLTGVALLWAQLDQADLSQAVLEKADLQQADLSGADLTHVMLHGATLDFAVLDGAVLTRADLRRVNAGNTSFYGAMLLESDFTEADLEESDFSFCRCDDADFHGAMLNRATFEGAVGHHVNFRGAELAQMRAGENARFPGSVFRRVVGERGNWAGADLRGADFILAEMPHCDFSRADLTDSDCRTADLKGGVFDNACLNNARFNRANLFQSRMEEADLTGTNFKGANLYGSEFLNASIDNKTNFDLANLKSTKLAELKNREISLKDG